MPDELYILLVVERENEVYSHECPFNTIFITGMSNTDILGRYCAEDVIGDDCLLHYRKYVKDKTATSGLCILYMQHEENTVFYHANPYKSMFDTIHHIAIIGSDYEKSKHFYVDLLGFEIIRENYRKERDDYKIDLACGEQEIELFIIKDAPARVNYPEALGLRHLAFKVKSVDDTVKELNAKGIATEPVRLDDYTGKKMTFFHDPDNLPLEIHE